MLNQDNLSAKIMPMAPEIHLSGFASCTTLQDLSSCVLIYIFWSSARQPTTYCGTREKPMNEPWCDWKLMSWLNLTVMYIHVARIDWKWIVLISPCVPAGGVYPCMHDPVYGGPVTTAAAAVAAAATQGRHYYHQAQQLFYWHYPTQGATYFLMHHVTNFT